MSIPRLSEAFEAIIASSHKTIQENTRQSLNALVDVGVQDADDIRNRFCIEYGYWPREDAYTRTYTSSQPTQANVDVRS